MLEKLFRLQELETTVKREIIGGCTTFLTMCYIIFVQPAMLSVAGMNQGAVMVATCLSSAGATFLIAFLANYPVALAPAMGINAYFVFEVCNPDLIGVAWPEALGIVFISGVLFILLSFVGLREAIMNTLPVSLHHAIAVGIGIFITFIGLRMSGIITAHPATFVTLGNFTSPPVLLSLFGILVILILMAREVRGAIIIGILATAALTLALGFTKYQGIVSMPPSILPTLFELRFPNIFARQELIPVIFVFFAQDMFDSIGTLTATGHKAELLKDGKLSKARQALLSDAIGSAGGAVLGTSTVTCYIESASGITAGARTGLASIVTGILMLLALFFYPVVEIVGSGYVIDGNTFYPVIAPALIIVGFLMLKELIHVDWDDITEAIPASLTLVMTPLAFSITHGIAFGFISIAFMKLVTGRRKELHPLIYFFAALFVARYIGIA